MSNIENEIWKQIAWMPKYSISSFGRVKSDKTGRILKTNTNQGGYFRISINNTRSVLIHQLVAIHFIDNPLNRKHVNHIDLNKKNNHVNNLEWCTIAENNIHWMSKKGKYASISEDIIRIIKQNPQMSRSNLASILGVKISYIKDIRYGRNKRANSIT